MIEVVIHGHKITLFQKYSAVHSLRYHFEFQSLQNLMKEPNIPFPLKYCL